MAITSNRTVFVSQTGSNTGSESRQAASNYSCPGGLGVPVALVSGNNTITVPSSATGVTISTPAGNTAQLTLKGVNGDTGVSLHLTDPTSIGLASSQTTFVLNAGAAVTVLLDWT